MSRQPPSDIYRGQLSSLNDGVALWDPKPVEDLYNHISIGDVGYLLEDGAFMRLFNVTLPWDHPSNKLLEILPEEYKHLELDHSINVRSSEMPQRDICSYVSKVDNLYANTSEEARGQMYECRVQSYGALLSLPHGGHIKNVLRKRLFKDYIRDNVYSWFRWSKRCGFLIERMDDLILVTGCTLVTSWAAAVFDNSNVSTAGSNPATISLEIQKTNRGGAQFFWRSNRGNVDYHNSYFDPTVEKPLRNQCIFVRGFRARRILFRVRSMRAAAEPLPDDPDNRRDDEIQMTRIPDGSKEYRDPLDVILDYIEEKCQEVTMAEDIKDIMAIAHYDDLQLLKDIETVTADAIGKLLREKNMPLLIEDGAAILCDPDRVSPHSLTSKSSTVQTTPSTSSTSNIQLITDALAEYTKITGIDLSKNPFAAAIERANSPTAILELLQEREKAFKQIREGDRRLISCLTPAVNVIQAFSGILGEAVSLVPVPPAKAFFVGIDVLLSAANGVTSSYDALINLFECLGSFLMRLEVYTTTPPTPMMMELTVKIIVELLSVLALATKQIKQGRFKKSLKISWRKGEIQDALERLDRLTKDEELWTGAQTLGVVHSISKVVMGGDQLQKDVQHWLSPPDPSTNQYFFSKARHQGTAAWFFESSALTEWKANGSLLWIHGEPGAGKSTLLSAIVQDVQDMHADGLATIAYYYFDFRDVKKQDCFGLVSSLVSQLSAESDSFYNVLSKLYSGNCQDMQKLDYDALKKCLVDMLSLPGQGKIYMIVDALDECPNFPGTASAREEVLEFVKGIVDLKLPNVNLCVASRPEIDIRLVLEPLTTLKISLHDETGQKKDIVKYIKSVVYSDLNMQRWKEEDKQLVVDTLSGKADGRFRWIVCQVDTLRRTLPRSIRNVLNDLPETLDETYSRILLRINEDNREYAQRLLQCLVVSIRPLRVKELAEILAVQFDTEAPLIYNIDWRPACAEEAIMSVCSSLIAIVDRGGHQVVQFSHFSVKEYLTSERLAAAEKRLSYYHILPEPAHTVLAHASLSVLLHLYDGINKNTIGPFPFARYAARHWTDHAQFRNVSSHIYIVEMMKRLFDPAKSHFAAWVWLYDIDHHWVPSISTMHPTQPEATPLYYASLCGFGALTEHLIAAHSPPDVNSKGGFHMTALHAASVKGHLQVASLLLRNGADPDSRDHLGRVPLHKVPQGGQLVMRKPSLEIARLLVNSGADVNATDDEGCTPLHTAAQFGYHELAELLLKSNAGLDARNKKLQTPLLLSCLYGKCDMAHFLIDHGSDINSRDETGSTPLHAAARLGHVDVTKLLIDRGTNVDSRDNTRGTPLFVASSYGHLKVARVLIEKGATVSAQNNQGNTPFHMAAFEGHLDITKFLLECGIDIDIRNGNGWTSLCLASWNGKLDVVRFLIKQGGNIYIGNSNNSNPLHMASENGQLDVVQLLINSGIPVDVRNGSQMTPLALASSKGKVEVARSLIHRGAALNVRDNQSQAPLHLTSKNGHVDMARLLLDHGVDPNIRRNDLSSPLHLASVNDHLKVAELLVQRGASVDIYNDKRETPLYRAVVNGNAAMARLLIDHGATVHTVDNNGWTLLHAASRRGHLGAVKLLLRRGADVGALNKAGRSAVELASENGQAEVVKFISEYKSNANTRKKLWSTTLDTVEYGADDDGKDQAKVSLHAAAEEGNIDPVKSLLERGMDINARDGSNRTPLDRAAEKGNFNVVRLLIERGAEVDSRDKWGWTPLHHSSRFGHLEVSRILLDHGANVNARMQKYWSPMHLSAYNGHLEIVKLLLERGADIHAINDEGETPYQMSLRKGYREIADLLQKNGADRIGESF